MDIKAAATPKFDTDLIELLRKDFEYHDFTESNIQDYLGDAVFNAYNQDDLLPAKLKVAYDTSALGILINFFLLHESVPSTALNEALPHCGVKRLFSLGLATETNGKLLSTFNLQLYTSDDIGNAWFFSDLTQIQTKQSLPNEYVLGIGNASKTLAQSIIRNPVNTALDLGCGCGIQTLHLLQHAKHVTATDLSNRALEITKFNLTLNAVDLAKVTLKQGSLFEPVKDETFELIISNPPFVISPKKADNYTYRESSFTGDALIQKLVNGISRHLTSSGIAQFIANWEIYQEQEWHESLQTWDYDKATMRVYLRELLNPVQYASMWTKDSDLFADEDTKTELLAAYLTDFNDRKVSAIGFGYFTIVKTIENELITEDITQSVLQPIWQDLAADIERHVAQNILDLRFKVAPDVTEERFYLPGEQHPKVIQLRQGSGLCRTVEVSTEIAAVVGACDGELTIREICYGLANILNLDIGELLESIDKEIVKLYRESYLDLLA
ncbi:MAG: methyltransferase [Micrococcaceae bacterium]